MHGIHGVNAKGLDWCFVFTMHESYKMYMNPRCNIHSVYSVHSVVKNAPEQSLTEIPSLRIT